MHLALWEESESGYILVTTYYLSLSSGSYLLVLVEIALGWEGEPPVTFLLSQI